MLEKTREAGHQCHGGRWCFVVRSSSVGYFISIPSSNVTFIKEEGGGRKEGTWLFRGIKCSLCTHDTFDSGNLHQILPVGIPWIPSRKSEIIARKLTLCIQHLSLVLKIEPKNLNNDVSYAHILKGVFSFCPLNCILSISSVTRDNLINSESNWFWYLKNKLKINFVCRNFMLHLQHGWGYY